MACLLTEGLYGCHRFYLYISLQLILQPIAAVILSESALGRRVLLRKIILRTNAASDTRHSYSDAASVAALADEECLGFFLFALNEPRVPLLGVFSEQIISSF